MKGFMQEGSKLRDRAELIVLNYFIHINNISITTEFFR